jgi:ribonuclease J
VEASGARLVLDVGRPLSAPKNAAVALPEVAGLTAGDASVAGVVITHAHQDHWGLADQVPVSVPLYMGEATHRILAEAAFWTSGFERVPTGFLRHRHSMSIGPFRVTPFLNDHSAFDAYSVLVEAGGRSLFYSGDIRAHGRKGKLFEQLVRHPPRGVNTFLMEGTNLRPDSEVHGGGAVSEDELELQMAEIMSDTAGMVLAISSAQNLDRLVTIYRAAKRSGRRLVMDLYTASIVRATGRSTIPQPGPDWPLVAVYVPLWQRVKVKKAGAFERVEAVKPYRVFEKDLARSRSSTVLLFSSQSGPALAEAGCLTGATAIWSLWSGYLTEVSGRRTEAFLEAHGVPLIECHTSGHASVPDLRRLAAAIDAERLVPIHTLAGHRFDQVFERVEPQADGKWWDV